MDRGEERPVDDAPAATTGGTGNGGATNPEDVDEA